MRRTLVGISAVVLLAGCGGSVKATAEAKPKAATTTSTSIACLEQSAAIGSHSDTDLGTDCAGDVCVQEATSLPWGDESFKEGMCDPGAIGTGPDLTWDAEEDTKTVLRNALTALKTYWTDAQMYTGDTKVLGEIEPSVDWDAIELVLSADNNAVCISATSSSGKAYALYDNPYGATGGSGIFFGESRCPSPFTGKPVAGFKEGW
jgi:hypothetical protein